jgi:hypothetical protein
MVTRVTANPAENGVAPGLASVGFGTGSFTSTPDGAGFVTTISNVDQVARFQVVPPGPGAILVAWGLDELSGGLYDPGVSLADTAEEPTVADFFMVLVDADDNFVGVPYTDPEPVPPRWLVSGGIRDGANTYVVPWFTPYLPLAYADRFTSGWAIVDLTWLSPGITDTSGHWIEIIGFSGSGLGYTAELTVGRIITVWDFSEGGWQVGSVGFS